MKKFNKRLIFTYLFFALWAIAVAAILEYAAFTSFEIIFTTFFLFFCPGFLLARLTRLNFKDDPVGQIVLYLVLGMLFTFILNFLAIIFGLTLPVLMWLFFGTLGILFILTFFLDCKKYDAGHAFKEEDLFSWREYFKISSLSFVLVLVYGILVVVSINQIGAIFKGDPIYHLSIVEKVIGGKALSAGNLSFLKDQLHPAYGLPIWPIFLGFLTKLFGTNIFTLWAGIPATLTALAILAWYWLFRKIMPNREMAVMATIFFLLYKFGNSGYIFTRMPVPDTLCQLLMLPLAAGMALKYIFEKDSNFKLLIVASLLALSMAAIHLTQFFYYLIALGFLAVLYAVFHFKDSDWKIVMKRILLIIAGAVAAIIPVLVYFQFKGALSGNLQEFAKKDPQNYGLTFLDYDLFSKIAYLSIPFVLLLQKKHRKFLFLVGLFLITPLIFNIGFIKVWTLKTLSFVFLNRLYGNVTWSFAVWAVVFGFVILLIDRLIKWIFSKKTSKYPEIIFSVGVFILALYLAYLGDKNQLLAKIITENFNLWLGEHYLWFLIILLVITVALYLLTIFKPKVGDFFSFQPYRNQLVTLGTLVAISVTMAGPMNPALVYAYYEETHFSYFKAPMADAASRVYSPTYFGDQATIDYINANIPPKSVFDSSLGYIYLPLVTDQFMSAYPYTDHPELVYNYLYLQNFPIEQRLACLKEGQIQYLMMATSLSPVSGLDQYSAYFTKIYEGSATIYQVQTDQVKLDAKNFGSDLVCGGY